MQWMTLLAVFGISLAVFLCVMIGMAFGFIMSRKPLRGSCGGIASRSAADGSTSCALCTRSDKPCEKLGSPIPEAEAHKRAEDLLK